MKFYPFLTEDRPNFLSDKFFNFTKIFTLTIWAFLFWLGLRALARGFNL
jgi:hypothetical protein